MANGVWHLAETLADRFSALPQVVAVALAGSQATGLADEGSDLDLYVYAEGEIPPDVRRAVAGEFGAGAAEIDNRFWEPGDEWVAAESGLHVDLMYRTPEWIEEQLERVLVRHEASVGYSTCFWYNVLNSRLLHDREEWYGQLRQKADRPYPEPLREAVVAKNYPILRDTHSSYRYQIEAAIRHRDRVSLNHRVAALLASYFDILFAVNRLPHPGEKQLVDIVMREGLIVPDGVAEQVERLITGIGAAWDEQHTLPHTDELVDGLDTVLLAEGLIP